MNIYVGNLPFSATDQLLQEHFAKFGTVTSARVILDRETGRSRGFGFVEMPDKGEGERALEGTNGADFMGRPLRVNESQPRDRNEGGGGGRGGSGGGGGRGGRGGFGGGGGGGGHRY